MTQTEKSTAKIDISQFFDVILLTHHERTQSGQALARTTARRMPSIFRRVRVIGLVRGRRAALPATRHGDALHRPAKLTAATEQPDARSTL